MTKTILAALAMTFAATAANAATIGEWVNPKGNTVLQVMGDGFEAKFRPLSGTWKIVVEGDSANWGNDLDMIDDYISESFEDFDFEAAVYDLPQYTSQIIDVAHYAGVEIPGVTTFARTRN